MAEHVPPLLADAISHGFRGRVRFLAGMRRRAVEAAVARRTAVATTERQEAVGGGPGKHRRGSRAAAWRARGRLPAPAERAARRRRGRTRGAVPRGALGGRDGPGGALFRATKRCGAATVRGAGVLRAGPTARHAHVTGPMAFSP
ncbi:hypothetical protein SSBG_03008 [Streptomyces sp. SPB074]|nr:hypothetical protein SSBG_03008 [Streptomyces sp. SPB074]